MRQISSRPLAGVIVGSALVVIVALQFVDTPNSVRGGRSAAGGSPSTERTLPSEVEIAAAHGVETEFETSTPPQAVETSRIAVPSADEQAGSEPDEGLLTSIWDFEPGWNGLTTDLQLQHDSSVYQPKGFRPVSLEFLGLHGPPPASRQDAYRLLVDHVLPGCSTVGSIYEGRALGTRHSDALGRDDLPVETREAAEAVMANANIALAPLVADLRVTIEAEYEAQLRGPAIKLFRRGEMPPQVAKRNDFFLSDYVAVGDWYCALEFDPLLNPVAAEILTRIADLKSRRDQALSDILD